MTDTSDAATPAGPFYVVAISWTNNGDNVPIAGQNVVAGCRRCPPAANLATAPSFLQSARLAGMGPPLCLFVVSFVTLLAAKAWKDQVTPLCDLVYWLPAGLCC